MTSRREHPTNAPGAPPAHRAGRTTHHHPASTGARCDDAYLDGLFTYCLSVMCEHESALAALGEALALADRQRARGRAPEDEQAHRPWLYALARWACSRRLADQKAAQSALVAQGAWGTPTGRGARSGQVEQAGRPLAGTWSAASSTGTWPPVAPAAPAVPASPTASPSPAVPAPPAASPPVPASPAAQGIEPLGPGARAQRRRELAALAWPEAAGISPEQREALELSVRHGLSPEQIAAVLSLTTAAAEDLLLNASCEVERTRAALRVVESGGCAAVARLAGDERLLLGTALRRELVRHVDECAQCRRAAEHAMAEVSWPGTAPASAALAVLSAPRSAVEAAVALARRARAQRTPRFDRAGFPVCENERGARRDRLRARALTSTVVAAVLAAPVVALWAAYRGAPVTGEPQADRSATAPDTQDGEGYGGAGGPGGMGSPPGSGARGADPDDDAEGRAGEADGEAREKPSREHGQKPRAPRRDPAAPPSVDRPSVPASTPDPAAPPSSPLSPVSGGTPTGSPDPSGSPSPSPTPTQDSDPPQDPGDSPS
ncbi:hypothetical protein [Streptomyces spirodelae]|uniref:Alanine-rich protein n=1 Tax=Streptomyces spirodelae TaxID=2812904 RepID=A0ABS3X2D8_9ACTN|nr:hypothetical protein [Streptomyces spirodelae]MBO8189550.1 hypothetical protein [Streptomyces spirodelae]